jgi:glutaredoxin
MSHLLKQILLLLLLAGLYAPAKGEVEPSSRIEVYRASRCPHCDLAVDLLREQHFAFMLFDLEHDHAAESHYFTTFGRGILPVVARGGKYVRGFNKERILALASEPGPISSQHELQASPPPTGQPTSLATASFHSQSVAMALGQPTRTSPENPLWIILGVLAVYLIPSYVAFLRRHPNRWPIALLNVFLGATGIAWFGCLIWAFHRVHDPRDSDKSKGGESGLNVFVNDVKRVELTNQLALSPGDEIERLAGLLKVGVINHREFEDLKHKLLAKSET